MTRVGSQSHSKKKLLLLLLLLVKDDTASLNGLSQLYTPHCFGVKGSYYSVSGFGRHASKL